MPKVSVYLPDDLYQEARARNLQLSSLAQRAVEQELASSRRAEWVQEVRNRDRRTRAVIDTAQLLADVRDEFGT